MFGKKQDIPLDSNLAVSNLYTILDRLQGASGNVFQSPNHLVALRMFRNTIGEAGVASDDYRLLHLGSYNCQQCVIESFAVPVDITPEQGGPK